MEEINPLEDSFHELHTVELQASPEPTQVAGTSSASIGGKQKRKPMTVHSCTTCGFKSKFLWALKRHTKMHEGILHQCHCGCKFRDMWEFTFHQKICGKGLICDKCGNRYNTRQGLRMHIRTKHEKSYPYNCTVCDHACSSKNAYVGHMNIHMASKVKCKKCSSAFRFPTDLAQHEKYCMTNKRGHVCDTCGDIFKRKKYLVEHIRVKHAKEERYKCKGCLRSFKWSSSLSYHKRHSTCGHD